MPGRRSWFLGGLFCSTLAALSLEILDTRLLSVLTWYHLAFLAVSVAMFGMSAGAVHVYLKVESFTGSDAPRALARFSTYFAISIPLSHIANLCLPFLTDGSLTAAAGAVLSLAVLAVPFYLAGTVVAIALTRVPGRIGLAYGVDLLGAAMGSLLVIPLLVWSNISSAVFAIGGFAAIGAYCFSRFAQAPRAATAGRIALVLFAAAVLNGTTHRGFRVAFAKGHGQPSHNVVHEAWNSHSQVVAGVASRGAPFFWGASPDAKPREATTIWMVIDGEAGTAMTQWDGRPESLDWVRFDVTSLPYHLRKNGDVAVIGVGGGRDVLTALWAQSESITGIEINQALIELLEGPLRGFANLAGRPDVRLVCDEARSYLTRVDERFDVIQMSLIDTWAATGAGAFSLTENGLYTLEAWDVLLGALKPHGWLSVSRWFSPDNVSETSRLLALGTASLLRRGVSVAADHMVLVSCGNVATLLVSNDPVSESDRAIIQSAVEQYGFDTQLSPWQASSDRLLGAIVSSGSLDHLHQVVDREPFDYTPPTDQRPYFFNTLKPSGLLGFADEAQMSHVARGNLTATRTLALLGLIAAILTGTVIFVPLSRKGLPAMDRATFVHAVLFFALIGLGYMLVQIPLMQRFSIYLGHPTYSIAVVLFSMILFTGIGSLLSDRLRIESSPAWVAGMALGNAALILLITVSLQRVIDATIHFGLPGRCLVVAALTAPVSLLLGFCFPFGLRMVRRLSQDAMPWMWGINGACGVLASVLAVWISMWAGIHTSLYAALVLYALLLIPAWGLWQRGRSMGHNSSAPA